MTDPIDPRLTATRLRGSGVDLHATVGGPEEGPLVFLLHGFPDAWWTWRGQVGPLMDAGFRVVAPTMRGYGESDKPPGVRSYTLDLLAADILSMADQLGRETFRIVGHDWGGIVAWEVAIRASDRVEALVAIDAPHPDVMRQVIRRNPSQILRSWYALFFQLPLLPERMLRAKGFASMRGSLAASSAHGTFSDADLDRYVAAWDRPGALTAMLSYYRALRHKPRRAPARVRPSTLVVWGGKDRFLSRAAFDASLEMCDAGASLWVDDATHWVHLEQPGSIADAVLTSFRASPTS